MLRGFASILASVAALIAVGLAPSAWALSPAASSFLSSIGLNPDDEAVKLADQDGEIAGEALGDPETFSLEKLALAKKPNAARQFIATRAFVRSLKADFEGTKLPTTDYNASFLTKDERQLVGRKVASTLKE
jgi:hypothetical protein